MQDHTGGDLSGYGPYSVDARTLAALHDAPVLDRADGPLRHEQHPPDHGRKQQAAAPAASSAALFETVPTPGLANTPAPTISWKATLQGKGGFPADAQIAVSTSHVVVTNRQLMRYYDKNGNAAASSIGSTTFFTAGLSLKDAAGNAIDRFNDLRVIFDSYRKRFWVTA